MKRAPVILAATAAGLAAVLGFSPHSKGPTASTVITTTAPAPSSSSSSSSRAGGQTVTSDAISTRYGNVQLRVTISGGKITNVQPVQLPSNDPKSSDISSFAVPQLQQSALSKQSANVDAVSGATYTSDGYKTALQSALDKAHFQASTAPAAS
jgi:uncharacterized protein with FMN-binding domain